MVFTAYIVDACRTATGKKKGALRDVKAPDLGAAVLDALVARTGIKGQDIDEVICGCVDQVGQQAGNIGRMSILASKSIPESVPGTAVDRQCGSGQQAIQFAAQCVMSGVQDVVVAMGVESMTNVPIGANVIDSYKAGRGQPSEAAGIQAKRPGVQFSQFAGAELLAKKYHLTREELDDFAAKSHQKCAVAIKEGRFKNEIIPMQGKDKDGNPISHVVDEGVRASTTAKGLAGLKVLQEGGIITAGTSSQIADGAAAVLICNENGLKKLGLRPRAKIVCIAGAGSDPVIMLEGPIPATQKALQKSGINIKDIDVYEVNEAFAPVPVAWCKAIGADLNRLNVNGGACANGHPLGGTVRISLVFLGQTTSLH